MSRDARLQIRTSGGRKQRCSPAAICSVCCNMTRKHGSSRPAPPLHWMAMPSNPCWTTAVPHAPHATSSAPMKFATSSRRWASPSRMDRRARAGKWRSDRSQCPSSVRVERSERSRNACPSTPALRAYAQGERIRAEHSPFRAQSAIARDNWRMNDLSVNTALEAQREIIDEFALFGDWTERYQYLIDLGRKLPPFPQEWMIEANKVHGCQSQVWMVVSG